MEDEDNNLVTQTLSGNPKAYEKLIRKYHKQVFHIAGRLVKYTDDAEEITQSAFVKAYENLGSFNPKYKFFSWLYRIAINESLNFIREKRNSTEVTDEFQSGGENPGEILDQAENGRKIDNALMELDIFYRVPVVLKHFMDYSYKELSILLNIPEKTVKSRLFTGRQILKEILLKYGITEK